MLHSYKTFKCKRVPIRITGSKLQTKTKNEHFKTYKQLTIDNGQYTIDNGQ
jgi:hypothetical protein